MRSSAPNSLGGRQPTGNAPPCFANIRLRLKSPRPMQEAHLRKKWIGLPGHVRKLIGSTRSFKCLTRFSTHQN
ncbi:hypothetical protein D9M69_390770 [compost metagenome]